MSEHDYVTDKRILFNSSVWRELENKNDITIREFIRIMIDLNDQYEQMGGQYPTVDFVLGMAIDSSKEILKLKSKLDENENLKNENYDSEDEVLTYEQQKQRVRDSWLNKFKKM